MTEQDKIYELVETLLQKGSLAKSAVTQKLRDFLQPALDSGVIAEERSGSGRRIAVKNSAALRQRLDLAYPNVTISADAPSRVAGVARYRDSKVLVADTPDMVTLRGWSETSLRKDGRQISLRSATDEHGVLSFVLQSRSSYELEGPWALVEGPVMLLNFERLAHRCQSIIYGNGRISNRILQWLAGQKAATFHLVHFPDYDPVGLSEFIRLRGALGARSELFIPEGLAERFKKFSKRSLLKSPANQAVLGRVRVSRIPEVRAVVELINKNNAGLEQEQLLIEMSQLTA